MAQRRSYAPFPTGAGNVNAHGREAGPPNLQPAPQPLPPRPQPQPMAASGSDPNATMGAPRPPLPASIPLRPLGPTPQSMQPQPGAMPGMSAPPPAPPAPGAGVSPANSGVFTQPAIGGNATPGADDDPHGSLLKLLAALGHTGAPDANS